MTSKTKRNNLHLVEIPKELFDKYVEKKHPEANFLQSSTWGEVYELTRVKTFLFGLTESTTSPRLTDLQGVALAILKTAKRGRYLEVPGGPLIDWSGDFATLQIFIDSVRAVAEKNHCVFVRMRPNIPDTPANRAIVKKLKLRRSPMHLHAEHTVMLDLEQSDEELLTAMRRQTRYDVRKADKLGIKVDWADSEKAFRDFYKLHSETAKRQGFIPSSRRFILAQHQAFGDLARIYTARYQDRILAQGLILLRFPEAIYHEAASGDEGRKYPGAAALQWQVIKDAKQLGLKRYNLFGIAPPNSPNHRYAGVTTFKTGFGGKQIAYLPAHDLVVKPIHYQFVHLLETIRKKHRRL
ncbi:peptidoglycan bridge formation glycyltransferase FemA/FemB family protein [Candidatus Saccharibacteria bacterium]|nr:peptidoglycan bridge formation glycyltransferase FemA/FemB family protein [Candidatus Saccharibacteria bacterium]